MKSILIIGASARAAAASAASLLRSRQNVHTIDLFADRDLRRFATATRIESGYPTAAINLARKAPPMPWMFTGGIENYPELIEHIQQERPLLGTTPDAIRKVRDHRLLSDALQGTDFRFPATSQTVHSRSKSLLKPKRSCGGTSIRWLDQDESHDKHSEETVVQQFIPGTSYSATFLTDGNDCCCLGVTRQILARESTAHENKRSEHPFAYVGSVGPLPEIEATFAWDQLGNCLVDEFSLRGLFGVDTVITDDGTPYVIEVNPRYTASMELIERSLRQSLIGLHVDACAGSLLVNGRDRFGESSYGSRAQRRVLAKAYYFARRTIQISAEFNQAIDAFPTMVDGYPRVADLPEQDATIKADQPVLTIFTANKDEAAAMAAMGWNSTGGWLERMDALARGLEIIDHV
jgi:predicted ATP-grasp superfamily ATP-dependent carboligase